MFDGLAISKDKEVMQHQNQYSIKKNTALRQGILTGCLRIAKESIFTGMNNFKVNSIFSNESKYFHECQKHYKEEFMKVLESEDTRKANEILNDILFRSVSYYDNKESFYHGFILGLLSDYEILSNEEAGKGRLDIVIRPRKMIKKVIIIECKYAKDEDDLIKESKEAIEQIKAKRYMEKPAYEMYGGVVAYGISFHKKQCYVVKSE